MTFLQILEDVYDRTQGTTTVPTETSRRIKRYVNRWHRRILSSPGMEPLRRIVVPKASVANQATYGIAVADLKYFTETTTDRRLTEKSLGWYRDRVPDPAAWTGTPLHYVKLGYYRYHTRPSAAAEIFVKSTSASDTPTAYLEAIRTDGFTRLLSVAMTGTTAVSLGAAITDVIEVVDFYLSTAAVGTVTLHEGSGSGTELSRIPIGDTRGRFLRYALAPTPSQVITYNIDALANITDLVNDTDEPFEHPDFHDILVDGAVYDEWTMKGRASDAARLLNGGSPRQPTPESIEGRIARLRMSVLDWPRGDDMDRARTFDESINLPIA